MARSDDRDERPEPWHEDDPALPPGFHREIETGHAHIFSGGQETVESISFGPELDPAGRAVAYVVNGDRWDFDRAWAACQDPEPMFQLTGMGMLRHLDPVLVEARLNEILATGDEQDRARAAELLAEVRSHHAMMASLSSLGKDFAELPDDPVERGLAIRERQRIHASAEEIETLLAQLDQPDADRRYSAARALAQIADPRTFDRLLAALRDDDGRVRGEAALALGQIGDDRALEPVLALLADPDPKVLFAVLRALSLPGFANRRAVEPILAVLDRPDLNSFARDQAIQVLGDLRDDRAIAPIISLLRRDRPSTRPTTPTPSGEEASSLDAMLAYHEGKERLAVVISNVLGLSWRSPASLPHLVAALQDDDPEYSHIMASTLRWLGDPRAVEPLIEALKSPHETVVAAALGALGSLKDDRAFDLLLGYLTHPTRRVRQAAALALGDLGDRRAFDAILPLVDDPDPDMRGNAAWSLARLGDDRATETLTARLHTEPHPCVRAALARALGGLGATSSLALLREIAATEEGVCDEDDGYPEAVKDVLLEVIQHLSGEAGQ